MIVLDTNVVSEPLKPRPDANVIAWLDEQAVETLHLPSTALAELLVGIERLDEGRKKRELMREVEAQLAELFGHRVLSFDAIAAKAYSVVVSLARANGTIVSVGDGQIGSIAKVHGFIVATRDVSPFLKMGVAVINPWEDKPVVQRLAGVEGPAAPEAAAIDVEVWSKKKLDTR